MVITDELETPLTNLPTTYGGLTRWFETWLNKLMVAKSMDSFPNATKCLSVLTTVLQPCLQGDALFLHSWNNKYIKLNLRDKVTSEDLEQLTRYMYLEARNRTRETRLEERVNRQVTDYVSSNAATPKANDGKCNFKTAPLSTTPWASVFFKASRTNESTEARLNEALKLLIYDLSKG
eukprot:3123698-Amphidinium_carterae.1